MKIKITTVGDSAGIILPKELLARLRLEQGDALYATELPDGIKLTPSIRRSPDRWRSRRRSCASEGPSCARS